MANGKNTGLIIGFDICDDYSQISVCNVNFKEPESVFSDEEKTIYRIPTVMYRDLFSGVWYFGEEAIKKADQAGEDAIRHFIKDYDVASVIFQDSESFEKKNLVSMFIINSLKLLDSSYPGQKPEYVTFTTPVLSLEFIEDIKELGNVIGVSPDNIEVMGHSCAYAYYSLCQKSDLWQRGTGMFEYNEKGLAFYNLALNKRYEALVVNIDTMDLSTYMSGDEYKVSDDNHLDSVFTDIAARLNINGKASAVYLTGEGFSGNWMKRSITLLCNGSRVFIGMNLYSRGACYHAMAKAGIINVADFKILCDDNIAYDISLVINSGRGDEYISVAKAGANYLTHFFSCKFMLKNTDRIYFRITDPNDGQSVYAGISLGDGIKRESSSIRYKMDISMLDGNEMEINVKDDGFGSLFPPTQKSWKRKLNLASKDNDNTRKITDRYVLVSSGAKESPFYLPISSTKVYSLEELAFYIFNNIYTVDERTFSEEMYNWLENSGSNPAAAAGLRTLNKRKASLREYVKYILFSAGIYDNNDWNVLNEKIANLESRNPSEAAKIEGDNYVRYGGYREAVKVYTSIIYNFEHDKEVADSVTKRFRGDVYHNLGTALARLLDFKAAEEAYIKAYELNKQENSLESYLYTLLVQDKKQEFKKAIENFGLSEEFTAGIKESYEGIKLTSEKKLASYTRDYNAYIKKQKNAFRE